jgi:hypothetical protein
MNNELESNGRKRSWPNIRYHPVISLEKLRKTTKRLSQNSRSPCRDSDSRPHEYESRGSDVLSMVVLSYINFDPKIKTKKNIGRKLQGT